LGIVSRSVDNRISLFSRQPVNFDTSITQPGLDSKESLTILL